jgi:guanosine-3',5'-bis(diphosphate) 3'-pyrophosphohydrolase
MGAALNPRGQPMDDDREFTIENAIAIAAMAHRGQRDKGGSEYIYHCLRVMAQLSSEAERMAGVLHDVAEDSSVTFEELLAMGAPDAVVAALRALTKLPGESRREAAKRAAKDDIARNVKLADVLDNMDLSRLKNPTERDRDRVEEYRVAKAILLASGARLAIRMNHSTATL